MLCPRCDQQGTVLTVRINASGEIVKLCNECDALWPSGAPLIANGFIDFSTYVKPLGLKGLWKEVTILQTANET
jgi:hypothetical protein